MNVQEICVSKNNHSWWWLLMPPSSYCRDIVVELEYVAGNWWFVGRRNYHADDMQALMNRGGRLVPVEKPVGVTK